MPLCGVNSETGIVGMCSTLSIICSNVRTKGIKTHHFKEFQLSSQKQFTQISGAKRMQWACEFRIQTFQSTVNSPNFSVNHVNSTKCDVVDVVLMPATNKYRDPNYCRSLK